MSENAGKYIIFTAGGSFYAVEFRLIREAVIQSQCLHIDYLHPCISGIANIKGDIVPVLNPYGAGGLSAEDLLLVIISGTHKFSFFCADIADILIVEHEMISRINKRKADYIHECFQYREGCVNIIDIEKYVLFLNKSLDSVYYLHYKEGF